ncbi:MAG: type IX secretion system sortase PorU [Bacteroidales bacterium]|nr:type IX secretion system sortase PorU [Bacteroidales bacterium]
MIRCKRTYCHSKSKSFLHFAAGLLMSVSVLAVNLPAHAVQLEWRQCALGNDQAEGPYWRFEGGWQEDSLSLPRYVGCLYPEASYEGIAIQFPVFEEIKGEALRAMKPMLQKAGLGESLDLQVRTGYERKRLCWDVSFLPFIQKGNRYYRLQSFEWAWMGGPSQVVAENTAANFTARRAARASGQAGRYASHSRLSQGTWVKISVGKTDVYKITYSQLRKLGIDPRKAQVYGYGGRLLAEDFSLPYVDDLPPVPVYRNEQEQYLLFYGLGPCRWYYDSGSSMYMREQNHYSLRGYYFIGENDEGSLEMETAASLGDAVRQTQRYTDFVLHEEEFYNPGATGRECYGEDFSGQAEQHFRFDMTGAVTDQSSRIAVEFVARSNVANTCDLSLDGTHSGQMSFPFISADNSYTYGYNRSLKRDFLPQDQTLDVGLHFSNSGTVKAAYLDYIILNLRKQLQLTGATLCFRDPASVGSGNIEYKLGGADAQTLVMDVTQPGQPLVMAGRLEGNDYLFTAAADQLREFVAVNLKGDIAGPTIEGRIDNQDLHGLPQADYVIITHPDFLSLARELAEAHTQRDSLRCVVVTAPQVYHEFSSGTPDATAYRRFMKMFYDRAETDEDLPQSLLLFGDGVYDNRLVTKNFSGSYSRPDKLLTYQSFVTLEGTTSYVTDDYFGFLDDSEGRNLSYDKLDIGVGRFPVRTLVEARTAVDKTLRYMQNKDKGTWKNTLLFMGDDGDDNLHTSHADQLAETVKKQHPEFMVNKIYVDAFERVTTASGTKVPAANQRFSQLLNSGLLMLNYSGHGSTTAWAVESLLSIKDIKSMKNTRLPLWVTATCDFCRYDDYETSGGEYVFLNENGGAIGLFTTSRVVYSGPNFTLNKAFIENIFNKRNGRRLSLGEVMCRTKQSSALSNDRNKLNFALIGDPALHLGYPEYNIRIDSINGRPVDPSDPDTLKSLSTVEMKGEILRTDLSPAKDFHGTLSVTVFDAVQNAQTLGNNGNDVFSYQERNKILYSGKSSVENGRFRLSFIVPKDLSYSYEPGQVNLYAYNHDGSCEAQGVFEDFLLGGTDATAGKDTIGPEIRLFMNDTLFADGGKTHATPTLIALLYDENGLNASGNSIGHDLMLTLDGEEKFNLNNYYTSELDSHVRGRIYFNLPTLDEGWHELSLKAWDMQNNSATASLRFQVSEKVKPRIMDIVFSQTEEAASFTFTHDRPAMWMTTQLRVYDLLGRLVWSSSGQSLNADNQGEVIQWNYLGENGRRVGDGVYICRLYVSVGERQEAVMAQKIIIGLQ